jgi:hypothetical protein
MYKGKHIEDSGRHQVVDIDTCTRSILSGHIDGFDLRGVMTEALCFVCRCCCFLTR